NLIIEQILKNIFLLEYIDLSLLKGALHSVITINRLVEDELRHDKILIKTSENPSLATMSSGQQKKALLSYLVAQKPEYMVLDDVYSNIDKVTQASITSSLSQLSETTLIIQVFFRKRDLLPCIKTIYSVDGENKIMKEEDAETFQSSNLGKENKFSQFKIPKQYDENHIDINPLVQLNDVSVKYGDKLVLNKVNWTIQQGEFWQLVGPNGSGKSTILSLITGDNPRGYGQNMFLFGKKKGSGESIWDIKRQIGYFTPSMIEQFKHEDTVENMIISGLLDSVGLYTKPTDIQKNIAGNWIEMLGEAYKNKTFQRLSIGQQRMVMVARAMVKHPPLLILDEPTIELDDENSKLFIEMVNAIAAEKKIAILYVSHRDEPDLKPDKIFELIYGKEGSSGVITQ
ncbi:MAG: ATP-binding cassette domain-containing protein, partial [Paludibacter sp.]